MHSLQRVQVPAPKASRPGHFSSSFSCRTPKCSLWAASASIMPSKSMESSTSPTVCTSMPRLYCAKRCRKSSNSPQAGGQLQFLP